VAAGVRQEYFILPLNQEAPSMSWTVAAVLEAWDRGRKLIDAAVAATAREPEQRAWRLAEALRLLWPSARAYGCLLRQEDDEYLAVLAGVGAGPAAEKEAVRESMARAAEEVPPGEARLLDRPPGQVLGVAPVAWRDQRYGALACAIDEGRRTEAPPVAALLAQSAERLAVLLYLEEDESDPDRDRRAWLTSVAEVTSVVTHEFNNHLNGILLHLALLQQEVPETLRPQLELIRQLGTSAASLVKRLQKFSRGERPPPQPLDLNQVVRDVVGKNQKAVKGVPVQLQLAPGLPPVAGTPHELRRLVAQMLANAVAAAAPGGSVTVRTDRAEDQVVFAVEDTGAAIAEEMLPRLFEPLVIPRKGVAEQGLAVCKGLARRLQGNIRGENRLEGGVAFIVEFTPADR
jgi:signal transduction histidine kinase